MREGPKSIALIGLAVIASGTVGPGAAQAPKPSTEPTLSHGYSRPARSPHSSRSEVIAPPTVWWPRASRLPLRSE